MNLYKALIKTCNWRMALWVTGMFTALHPTVMAQPADIASEPIFSTITPAVEVKPNIMMVMDDSGSMSWSEMPDQAWSFINGYGYVSSQCNGVYYNPLINYAPPLKDDGTSYPNQSFTAAQYDGFNTAASAFSTSTGLGYLNLSTQFKYNLYTPYSSNAFYGVTPSAQSAAFYFKYTGAQRTEKQKNYYDVNSNFYKECASTIGSAPGSSVFTKVPVNSTSGLGGKDERTNFANWFSYYRTRMLMMKTGTGQAFSKINDKFRVGYMTINNATGTDYLNITDFSAINKKAWFEQLYKSEADGATPLREALADAGKIYAGKKTTHNGQPVVDPVQYACQQNYTILSTDGYWNGVDASVTQLDGTTVMDNQDQNLPRPYKDDSGTTYLQSTTQEQETKFYWSTKSVQTQKRTWSWGSWSVWKNASSCKPGFWNTVQCRPVDKGTTSDPAQCPSDPVSGTTTRTSTSGLVRTCSYVPVSSKYVAPGKCTPATPTAANSYVTTRCSTQTTGPTELSSCTPQAPALGNNFMKITCGAPYTGGGTPNTLADTAYYYWNTDLRTPSLGNCIGKDADGKATNLCVKNKVPATDLDPATWQHMTTFTLGLGARGRMIFSPSYLTDTTGDFFDIKMGNNAGANNCTWGVSGQPCNWPKPGMNKIENIDDLWHAAINGHGNYFSATDPEGLANALSSSLSTIVNTPMPGTAASASTSNPKITSSNNFQFSSYFKSMEWSGELIRQPFNLTNGSVPPYNHLKPDPAMFDWSAQAQLDTKTYTSRNIYFKGTRSLELFNWANLKTAQLNSYFEYNAIKSNIKIGISQFCSTASTTCIDVNAQKQPTVAKSGAAGEALVNFLRGDRSNEEGAVSDKTKFYRKRAHVLGDIVSAQPLYVGSPTKTYTDTGYAGFKSAQAQRKAMVYGASNDGMLHAFDVDTGEEKWAFIPTAMLPKLHLLADKKYADKHEYFVEGTPKSGDVFINGEWKTILVGGFNAGGTGYYALDITDPLQPVYLWEYTDKNMGLTFGNPEITKLDNGTWVVLVTSGYNNCTKSNNNKCATTQGNGNGYLYVLDAKDGKNYTAPISTGVGNASGLALITAQAGTDNVTKKVYGGDLQGNLWRFNIETTGTNRFSKQKIAVFKDASAKVQPITTRPQVTTHKGFSVVLVGTGRYLGATDVGASQRQSFYAVKDNISTAAYESIRNDGTFIKKTAVDGKCPTGVSIEICAPNTQIRTVSINTGSLATDSLDIKNGWYLDFPANAGELSITDPKLVRASVTFTTSVPVASTAAVCGESNAKDPVSFSYTLSYLDGGPVNSEVAASSLGVGISTSPQIIQLPDGKILVLTRTQSGTTKNSSLRISANAASNNIQAKRSSWRELR